MCIRKLRKRAKKMLSIWLVLALALSGVAVLPETAVKVRAATAADVIRVAASQVNYHEKASNANLDDFTANSGSGNYTKYARDLGVGNGQPWCAYFVWWCMQTAGVDSNNYPRVGYATRDWFRDRGLWHDRGTYTPNPGDYIAFGSHPDHCGIVEYVSNGEVHTIEGNSSDQVIRHHYPLDRTYIMGYGSIQYSGSPVVDNNNPGSPYPIPSRNLSSGSSGDDVKWVQKGLNELIGAGLGVDGIYGNATAYAVKVFQSNNGLTADGIVGTDTTNKMLVLWRGKINPDTQKPTISNVSVSEVSLDGYRVTCTVSDNVGVTEVLFPTWTIKGNQDDIIWHKGSISGNTATYYVRAAEHGNGKGNYITHIYARDAAGNQGFADGGMINLSQLGKVQNLGEDFYAVIQNPAAKTVLQNMGTADASNAEARTVLAYQLTGAENQLWHFQRLENGSYEIISLPDGRLLDYYGGKDISETKVWAYPANQSNGQRWFLYQAGNGTYYLQGAACEDTVLDLCGGSNKDGTKLEIYSLNKSVAQQYSIRKYYQVHFKNDGQKIKTEWVAEGNSATAPVLSRDGYKLSWDRDVSNVKSEMTVNAVWTKEGSQTTENPSTPTETPKRTENPEWNKTAEPEKTEEPEWNETEKPQETGEPEWNGTAEPEKTGEPQWNETAEPEKTKEPEWNGTAEPEKTEKPWKNPVNSQNPVQTMNPVRTTKPAWNADGNPGSIERTGAEWDGQEENTGEAQITLAAPVIKKLSNRKKRRVVIKIKKAVNNARGYQIRYSTRKSMASAKKLRLRGKNTLSKTVGGLKKQRKYYFSVRSYRVVSGRIYYSRWSRVKSIKIKK